MTHFDARACGDDAAVGVSECIGHVFTSPPTSALSWCSALTWWCIVTIYKAGSSSNLFDHGLAKLFWSHCWFKTFTFCTSTHFTHWITHLVSLATKNVFHSRIIFLFQIFTWQVSLDFIIVAIVLLFVPNNFLYGLYSYLCLYLYL